ncbi:MAG TPA: aldo/keto reductase [Symbiobacteriaceae bacterium]|nr:aldo/keto reductase [Symbiobacteriaceae bacterium]
MELTRTPHPLTKRPLAHMTVPVMSLGGAGLGGIFGPVGDAEGVAAVHKALELGMNYLDTSPKYGEAERRMGLALKGVPRSSYFISSKVGTHPQRPLDYSADAAYWTVANSLKVLGCEYLDIGLIHEPEQHHFEQAIAKGGALEALVDLKRQGVIKAIGIGVQDHEMHRRLADTGFLDVALTVNDYTLLRQSVVDGVCDYVERRGVSVINGAALAMGLLSGRDPDSIGTPKWKPPALELAGARQVHAWCKVRGVSVLALALQFSLRQPRFACTLIGAATPAEVQGCWDAATQEIPAKVWEELPALLDAVRVE